MSERLLRTKLYVPPLRPNLVPRPRLIDQLNQALQLGHKLTLVSAIAGSGKTTLISSWIHQLEAPVAWLSLDEGDNESFRFVHHVFAALQGARYELNETVPALLQSPQPPPIETLLTLIINDLANLPGRVVLVLDDYHVIRNLDIHKAVTFLLDNQPHQFHLVLISREDPALPLHRWRGSGQMVGIYAHDLRFRIREASQFLNETMALSLSHDEITVMEKRTEGWIAGLQLAALSMQDLPNPGEFVTSFGGDDRYITDYLLGETINQEQPQVQEFLLRTAIVDRFCGALSDALMDVEDQVLKSSESTLALTGQAIIERLDQRNLFIVPLDNRREWYRYHHLLTDFLRMRLRGRPATEVATLHCRAATWFAQHDFIDEAIDHYLAAEEFAQAAELIERVGIELIVRGQLSKMLEWLAKLPDGFIATRPMLCVCHAWIFIITGRAAASEPLLQMAEQSLPTVNAEQALHINGLIDMLRAYRARRQADLAESIQLLRQASERLLPSDLLVRSTVNLNLGFNYLLVGQLPQAQQALQEARMDSQASQAAYVTLIAMAVLANSYVAQGKLRQAIVLYEETIADGLARNNGRPSALAGYAYAGLGQVMYEQNKRDRAEQLLTEAVQLGESIADWSIVRRGLLPLAWLKLMAGDPVTAEKLWQQALSVVQLAESGRVEAQLEAYRVRMRLVQAALDSAALAAAADWAKAYRERRPDVAGYQETLPQMIVAQVDLAQGQVDQAISRLSELADTAEAGGYNDNLIKVQTLLAIAHEAKGEGEAALEMLDTALALAAPEGYVRAFVDHGQPARRLLERAAVRGLASDYVAHLLAAFPAALQDELHVSRPLSPRHQALPVEPLTENELSMLRLMAAGRSNQEIADELYLSVNTIKVYASRLYSKLGVHRRGEAVAKAQELNLL